MPENLQSSSALLARLTISALEKATKDPACWKKPIIHKALIISGLNLLVASNYVLLADLSTNHSISIE